MNDRMFHKMSGHITYWNQLFGFIRGNDGNSYHFHKSQLKSPNILFNSSVKFKGAIETAGKYEGKYKAIDIIETKPPDFNLLERKIGILDRYDPTGGYGIISLEENEEIIECIAFKTRYVFHNHKIEPKEIVIFDYIKSESDKFSIKNFAIFIYPLSKENNLEFLNQSLNHSNDISLRNRIIERINIILNEPVIDRIPNDESDELQPYFEKEFEKLGPESGDNFYSGLVNLIAKYEPTSELLANYLPENILLRLHFDGIRIAPLTLQIQLFKVADKSVKIKLLEKALPNARFSILKDYINLLINANYVNYYSREIISVFYYLDEYLPEEVPGNLRVYLLQNIHPDVKNKLYENGHIGFKDCPNYYETLEITNYTRLNKNLEHINSQGYEIAISKLINKFYDFFEDIMIDHNDKLFNIKELEDLIIIILIISDDENIKKDLENFKIILRSKLNQFEIFIIWIYTKLNINDFEITLYYKEYSSRLSWFNKLLLDNILHTTGNYSLEDIVPEKINIYNLYEDLKQGSINWGNLFHPTKIYKYAHPVVAYLTEIENYANRNVDNIGRINIIELAENIFNLIPKYQVHHIRLVLNQYIYCLEDYYKEFRIPFVDLTRQEKVRFKEIMEEGKGEENIRLIINSIESCMNFEELDQNKYLYNASIKNIFFSENRYKLRLKNNEFTSYKVKNEINYGFNRIPINSKYGKLNFKIKVKCIDGKNEIESDNLEILTDLIFEAKILSAFTTNENIDEYIPTQSYAYAEDYELRDNVIDFLAYYQVKGIEPKIVKEPLQHGRTYKSTKRLAFYQTGCLYTHEANGEYAIIWENIGMDSDKSTYIFKTTKENYDKQIEKIIKYISSLFQFRTILSSRKEEMEYKIFRNNLGFIKSLHKLRAKDSFSTWFKRYQETLQHEIPIIPSDNDLKRIENWNPIIKKRPNNGNGSIGDEVIPTGTMPVPKNELIDLINQIENLNIRLRKILLG